MTDEERQQLLDAQELLNIDYTPVQIHKDNIVEMIIAEVKNRNDFSSHALFNLENHLKDLITWTILYIRELLLALL